jgi:hypothetical protein
MLSHAPASLAIPPRSFGVFAAPTLTALVTPIRLALRSTPSPARASIGARTLATIASSTEIDHYAAASAEKTADCLLHRRTTLNRRTTSHAALMLHSGGFYNVVNPVNPRCGNEASTLLVGRVPCHYASVSSDAKNARATLAAATRRSQSRLRSVGNAMTGESR